MKKIALIATLLLTLGVLSGCKTKPQPEDAVVAPEATVTENESATAEGEITDGDVREEKVVPEKTETQTKEEVPAKEEKPAVKAEVKTEVKVETKTETPKAQIKTFNMVAKNFTFAPSTITVNEGDTVRINLSSTEGTHGLVIPDFGVNKVVSQGAPVVLEFVASKKGTFGFRCSVMCGEGHGDMKGTLIVQ
ncbi:MAG: cupredoxin domain-containing protein [Patescibacteria group bacterium]